MKTVTSPMQTKLDTAQATEPLVIVKIEWTSGTVYYSEKPVDFGAIECEPKLQQISNFNNQQTVDNSGTLAEANITLDDDMSETLKLIFDTLVMEGSDCTIYHYYAGLNSSTDPIVMLKGKINADILYSDGARTLSFSINDEIIDQTMGYSYEQITDINSTTVSEDAKNKPWPLVFGTVIKSPALQIKGDLRTRLVGNADQDDSFFTFEEGYKFPQSSEITVTIDGVAFKGTMSNNKFTITESVIALQTNVDVDPRVAGELVDLGFIFWVNVANDFEGKYLFVNEYGGLVNYCVKQIGKVCYCKWVWGVSKGETILLDDGDVISEVAKFPRASWSEYEASAAFQQGQQNLQLADPSFSNEPIGGKYTYSGLAPDFWEIRSGAEVIYQTDEPDIYIPNLIETENAKVLEVYAYRLFNGLRVLEPVPSSYFTVDENNSTLLAGMSSPPTSGTTCTTIEFANHLADFIDEHWESDIYVSLQSSVGSNVADIIQWIVETYLTDLSVDAASFASVNSSVEPFPAGFTITDEPDAWDMCLDIAWQARCAIWVSNDEVFLKYLSEVPTVDFAAAADTVLLKTSKLNFTSLDDISLKFIGRWQRSLTDIIQNSVSSNPANQGNFKVNPIERDFFIYNIEELVDYSVVFWGYRAAYSWRRVNFAQIMKFTNAELFDTVGVLLNALSDNQIKGFLSQFSYDINNTTLNMDIILAAKTGDIDGNNQPIEDLDFWTGGQTFPAAAPTWIGTNLALIDYEPIEEGDYRYMRSRSDAEEEFEPVELNLVFLQIPAKMTRGIDYDLQIGVTDAYGNLIRHGLQCEIIPRSSDGGDVFTGGTGSPIILNIQNGLGELTNFSVDSGDGVDSGSVTARPFNMEHDRDQLTKISAGHSGAIQIGDDLVGYSFDEIPLEVVRGMNLAIDLTGPALQADVPIHLESSDPDDKLTDENGTPITTIDFDGAGNFTALTWKITGGSGDDDSGIFVITDPGGSGAELISDKFSIVDTAPALTPFIVSVWTDGGVAGGSGVDCTFTYRVKYFGNLNGDTRDGRDPDDGLIDVLVTPVLQRMSGIKYSLQAGANGGSLTAGGFGMGIINLNGSFELLTAYEFPETGGC